MKSKFHHQQGPHKPTSSRTTPPHVDRKKKTSEPHYASSAFFNSPDPSMLPVPDFDDDENETSHLPSSDVTPTKGKTDTLKQFLNIRSNSVLTVSN